MLRLLFALSLLPFRASAVITMGKCAFDLGPAPAFLDTRFSESITLPNGHEMFVRIDEQRGRPPRRWFLLVHGLLETHRSYDKVAELLVARGYGVVRPDLPGFGRSLLREIQERETHGRVFYPESVIPYQNQVTDLVLLLQYLRDQRGIANPDLVGHSMGGALVLATAVDPRAAGLIGDRVTGVAPYIYRVDFDLLEFMMYLGFDPVLRLNTVSQYIPRAFKAGSSMLMDGWAEQQLRRVLNDYFDEKILRRELNVDPAHLVGIRRQYVTSAIAAKRGLEEFNAYDLIRKLPVGVRYDLVYGENDPLIRKGAAVQFGERVQAHGGQVLGLDTNHDVTETRAPALVERLLTP